MTSTLATYQMPSAADLPSFEVANTETPTRPEPARREGDRRVGDDRLDAGGPERRRRCAVTPRRAPHRPAAHARARLAGAPRMNGGASAEPVESASFRPAQERDSPNEGADWRAGSAPGLSCLVATVIPISDRRARLAFILVAARVPSLGITIPAAIWLGVGLGRGSSGSRAAAEPAMGFIALVDRGARRDDAELRPPEDRSTISIRVCVWTGIAWGVALATVAAICTASILRIHPERWGALLVARAGLIGAMAAAPRCSSS